MALFLMRQSCPHFHPFCSATFLKEGEKKNLNNPTILNPFSIADTLQLLSVQVKNNFKNPTKPLKTHQRIPETMKVIPKVGWSLTHRSTAATWFIRSWWPTFPLLPQGDTCRTVHLWHSIPLQQLLQEQKLWAHFMCTGHKKAQMFEKEEEQFRENVLQQGQCLRQWALRRYQNTVWVSAGEEKVWCLILQQGQHCAEQLAHTSCGRTACQSFSRRLPFAPISITEANTSQVRFYFVLCCVHSCQYWHVVMVLFLFMSSQWECHQ